MAGLVGKFVFNKILKEGAENKFGQEDPYFEHVPATSSFGKRSKRRKKALPPGISNNDAMVLTKVKRRAYRLDNSFNLCGIRAGWSSIVGFLPIVGDFADVLLAMLVLNTCRQVDGGLPNHIKSKMMMNIIIDFAVGLVPFLGDVADIFFRANTRNAVVLESFLRERGASNLKKQGKPVGIDMSLPENNNEYDSDEHTHPDNRERFEDAHSGAVAQPPPVYTRGSRSSWFGRRDREPDLEMQDAPARTSSKRAGAKYSHPTTLSKHRTGDQADGLRSGGGSRRERR